MDSDLLALAYTPSAGATQPREVFVKAPFISIDGLNAPQSKGRFGASLYVTEEITEVILPAHQGIIYSSTCSY